MGGPASCKLRNHPRIVVVGTSCSGKTTFARSLAEKLGRQHIELDALYWGPGWSPNPEFTDLVRAALEGETWIIDGNYSRVRDHIWERATALVWLNYAFPVVFGRALARTVRRMVSGEPLFAGNRESFRGAFLSRDGIPWWVIRTYRRRRREYPALLREPRFGHLAVLELRCQADAMALLADADL